MLEAPSWPGSLDRFVVDLIAIGRSVDHIQTPCPACLATTLAKDALRLSRKPNLRFLLVYPDEDMDTMPGRLPTLAEHDTWGPVLHYFTSG